MASPIRDTFASRMDDKIRFMQGGHAGEASSAKKLKAEQAHFNRKFAEALAKSIAKRKEIEETVTKLSEGLVAIDFTSDDKAQIKKLQQTIADLTKQCEGLSAKLGDADERLHEQQEKNAKLQHSLDGLIQACVAPKKPSQFVTIMIGDGPEDKRCKALQQLPGPAQSDYRPIGQRMSEYAADQATKR